jgi:hypothetical protein
MRSRADTGRVTYRNTNYNASDPNLRPVQEFVLVVSPIPSDGATAQMLREQDKPHQRRRY